MTTLTLVFALLVLYQLKHWFADYPMQGRYMLGKFRAGWDFLGPLATHCSVHAMLTLLIVIAFTGQLWLAFALATFDFTAHFIMDRLKAAPHYLGRWKALSGREMGHILSYENTIGLDTKARGQIRGNTLFWWCLGLDQMVHHLTHYAIIFFILTR